MLEQKKILQSEVDVNNTLNLFDFSNKLLRNNQLQQWIELYSDDLKINSINNGQPLGLQMIANYNKLILDAEEALKLGHNYIARAMEMDRLLSSDKESYSDYDRETFVNELEQLKMQPSNMGLLNNNFERYFGYCLKYKGTDKLLGVYVRWEKS